MDILLLSATQLEIGPFIKKINNQNLSDDFPTQIVLNNVKIDILITGIGLVFTAYQLTKALSNKKYDLVINAGIAGSYNSGLKIGNVVMVELEEFSDLGVEDKIIFQTIFEKGFIKMDEFPFKNGKMFSSFHEKFKISDLNKVKGISSNTTHGSEKTIRKVIEKFNPDIETMEGAAFFYVCLMEKVNFMEIRVISNYVEVRDTTKWNIPLAIENLSIKLIQIINSFAN